MGSLLGSQHKAGVNAVEAQDVLFCCLLTYWWQPLVHLQLSRVLSRLTAKSQCPQMVVCRHLVLPSHQLMNILPAVKGQQRSIHVHRQLKRQMLRRSIQCCAHAVLHVDVNVLRRSVRVVVQTFTHSTGRIDTIPGVRG